MADKVTYEMATTSLTPAQMAVVGTLHERMLALGCTCAASAAGGKHDKYKIEYRKGKPARSLLVLRIEGMKWSALLKLYHLQAYAELLDDLSEQVRCDLLAKPCGFHPGGCKGPVCVTHGGEARQLCRHAMQVKAMSEQDLPAALALLAAEDSCIG